MGRRIALSLLALLAAGLVGCAKGEPPENEITRNVPDANGQPPPPPPGGSMPSNGRMQTPSGG